MGFLRNFRLGENDEILFFILIFLFLFCNDGIGGIFGRRDGCDKDATCDSTILFFIILFLLLFTDEGRMVAASAEC